MSLILKTLLRVMYITLPCINGTETKIQKVSTGNVITSQTEIKDQTTFKKNLIYPLVTT